MTQPESGDAPLRSGSGQPQQFRFSAAQRLRLNADFQAVYAKGKRVGDDVLLVAGMRNASSTTRIGLSVSRRQGCAAVRNRKKRRMREAFRLSQHQLPQGLDLILIPRQNVDASVKDYCESLIRLSDRLAKKLARETPDSGKTSEGRPT